MEFITNEKIDVIIPLFDNSAKYLSMYKAEISKYSNFNYDIVLSRENVEDCYHGYIHEVYMKKYADVVDDRRFYICGWSGMIDEAMDKLTNSLGYPKSQIRNELYG